VERELKLVLDAGGYFRLASALPGYEGERWLANHYFDTADRALRSRGAMLRVRESAGARVAGLKQGVSAKGGAFEAAEWEQPLAPRDWARVARAGGDLGLLDHPVVREAFALARATVLSYIGTLRVLRKVFRLSPATALELDLVCFEDGAQDWEIEVETERPEGVRPFVEELLERRGIRWHEQTRTKYERFLARRGDVAPPPLFDAPGDEVETVGDGVVVRRSLLLGAALYATRRFGPDESVLTIEGQPTWGVRPPGRRCIQIGRRSFLDVTGRPAGRVRHSCLPSCGLRAPRELVALSSIEPGEEITFDYAMTEPEVELVCVCGTAACRGLIGGWRRLPARLRRAYRNRVAEYLLEDERPAAKRGEEGASAARGSGGETPSVFPAELPPSEPAAGGPASPAGAGPRRPLPTLWPR
jgi:uncharacterized protein YjbK